MRETGRRSPIGQKEESKQVNGIWKRERREQEVGGRGGEEEEGKEQYLESTR